MSHVSCDGQGGYGDLINSDQTASQKQFLRNRLNRIISKIPYILPVLILWHLIGMNFASFVFPDILETLDVLLIVISGNSDYNFVEHTYFTLARILLVFAITMPLGILLGITLGLNKTAEHIFSPFVLMALAFPSVVWAYLGVIWWGLTDYLVPVFVGIVIIMPYVTINLWEGTKDIDQDLMAMARSYGANKNMVWRYIVIPHLMPYIFAMMRITLAVGWKVMLVAELFGTKSGLGFVIREYFRAQRNDMIIAWSIPLLIGIYLIERLISRQEARYYVWRDEEDLGAGFAAGGQ